MDELTSAVAGQILAHAYSDEMSKISMSTKAKMLAAGGGGLATGLGVGSVLGYKAEQRRLSPKERKIVQSAMVQAYRKGNMDMYQRLRSMARSRGAKSSG